MKIRSGAATLLALASLTAHAQNPNQPVGPVKPVVVEGTVTVDTVLDQPIEVVGSVSSSANREVFRLKRFLPIPAGSPSGSTVRECFDVPADRWLIIEQIHAFLLSETPPDTSFVSLRIEMDASGTIGTGFGSTIRLEPAGDRDLVALPGTFYNVTETTKLYSSPGSMVCMFMSRGLDFTLAEETGSVALFGILTDQP